MVRAGGGGTGTDDGVEGLLSTELKGAQRGISGPWRRVVRIPSTMLVDSAALMQSIASPTGNVSGAIVLLIDAPMVTDEVLDQAVALQHACEQWTDGGATCERRAITVVHGAIDTAPPHRLLAFAGRADRALVPVVSASGAVSGLSGSTGERVRLLAESGAVTPVELRLSLDDKSASYEACCRWAELNRLAGLLLTPAEGAGLGPEPGGFAAHVLRVYEHELVPSERLFPVNVILATLSGGGLAPVFAADPLGQPVTALRAVCPLVAPEEFGHRPAFADLLRLWERFGVTLPSVGSADEHWLAEMAGPIYARLVAQLAERLVSSAEQLAAREVAPVRWRARSREGRVVVERAPLAQPDGHNRGVRSGGRHRLSRQGSSGARTSTTRPRGASYSSARPGGTTPRHHPQSLPRHMPITVLDLDVTKRCNLRCVYCFKSGTVHAAGPRMSLEVAKAAVDWLIDASNGASQLWVNLMGGEPLLAWRMIEQLVPYAKRRAGAFGAAIQFGTTTNLTLVTPAIVDFSRRWGMGWHCSIDGVPEMQDSQRPGVGGRSSWKAAERGAKLVLGFRPTACARATVTAPFVPRMYESLRYFEGLGFVNFAFAPADEDKWQEADFRAWEEQWRLVGDHVIARYRAGKRLMVGAIDWMIEAINAPVQRQFSCGAGRGSVLADAVGDLWPCHRWDGADFDAGAQGQWRFGNIFSPGFQDELHLALLDRDRAASRRPTCDGCRLEAICAGGCPAANLSVNHDIYRVHPHECRMIEILCDQAVRVHDVLKAEANKLFMEAFYGPEKRRVEVLTDGPR